MNSWTSQRQNQMNCASIVSVQKQIAEVVIVLVLIFFFFANLYTLFSNIDSFNIEV